MILVHREGSAMSCHNLETRTHADIVVLSSSASSRAKMWKKTSSGIFCRERDVPSLSLVESIVHIVSCKDHQVKLVWRIHNAPTYLGTGVKLRESTHA